MQQTEKHAVVTRQNKRDCTLHCEVFSTFLSSLFLHLSVWSYLFLYTYFAVVALLRHTIQYNTIFFYYNGRQTAAKVT